MSTTQYRVAGEPRGRADRRVWSASQSRRSGIARCTAHHVAQQVWVTSSWCETSRRRVPCPRSARVPRRPTPRAGLFRMPLVGHVRLCVRSTWSPTEKDLTDYADTHIAYEVRTMLYQVVDLDRRQRSGRPGDMVFDALIEAVLVHVRLLDEFLGNPQQAEPATKRDRDTVFAAHYLPRRAPASFLTQAERGDVNAQVAHLSGRRRAQFPWSLMDLTERCCAGLHRFFADLGSDPQHSTRLAMFSSSRILVQTFLTTTDRDRDFRTTA